MRISEIGLVTVLGLALSGCGGRAHVADPEKALSTQRPVADAVPTAVKKNQKVLTRRQSLVLVTWTSRFRTCLAQRGLPTSVRISRSELAIRVRKQVPRGELGPVAIGCGDRLGGPPIGSSIQLFGQALVLYLPKQCLLDARVARGMA
jgi:hypothetical protein